MYIDVTIYYFKEKIEVTLLNQANRKKTLTNNRIIL